MINTLLSFIILGLVIVSFGILAHALWITRDQQKPKEKHPKHA
jgi:hypothetical protein